MGRGPYMRGWSGSTSPSSIQGSPGLAQDPQYSREIVYCDESLSVSAGNVYATYAEADAALQALGGLPADLVIVGAAVMQSGGPYRWKGVKLRTDGTTPGTLTIASGATIDGFPAFVGDRLEITCQAAKPITAPAGLNFLGLGIAAKLKGSAASGAELFTVPSGSIVAIIADSGSEIGDGTNGIAEVQAGGVLIPSIRGLGGSLKNQAITGAGAVACDGNNPGAIISQTHALHSGSFSIGSNGGGAGVVSADDSGIPITGGFTYIQGLIDALFNGTLERLRFSESIGDPASPAEGDFWWSDPGHTIRVQTDVPGVTADLGKQSFLHGVNKTGAQIDKNTWVRISGASGSRPTITAAIASGSLNPEDVIGVVSANIANNAVGIVKTYGTIRGLDTDGIAVGTRIYLSPSAAGEFTTTRPKYPDQEILLGWVTAANPSQGEIFCAPQLFEIHENVTSVELANPAATTYAIGHIIQMVAAQAISDAAPYTFGSDLHNDEIVLNVTAYSGALTARITGNSVNQSTGAITAADTEDLAINATGFYRTSKHWIDDPTISILEGTSNLTADIYRTQYGIDSGNNFRIVGLQLAMTPNAGTWGLEYFLYRLEADGTTTLLENDAFADTDANQWAANGEPGTFRLSGLEHDFDAANDEGLILQIDCTAIEYASLRIMWAHTPA